MGYGAKSYLGIGFQAAISDSEIGTQHLTYFEYLDESVTQKIPQLTSQGMRGIFDEGDAYTGPKMYDGDINIESRSLDIGIMLRAMFATDPVTTTEAGMTLARQHVWLPDQADFAARYAKRPFTIYKYIHNEDDANDGEHAGNMNASSLEISWANGDFVKSTLSVMGGHGASGAIADLAAPSFNTDRRMKWDTTSVTYGGGADCDFSELTLTIDDSLAVSHAICNTPWPTHIKRSGFRSITLAGTLKFNSRAHLTDFLNQTEKAFTITTTGAFIEVGDTIPESLLIEIPAFRYSEFDYGVGGPGELELSFTGTLKYDITTSRALRITQVNSKTTYAIV